MVHNILYCTIHDKILHGLRPTGPHFVHADHKRLHPGSYSDAEKDGTLKDLGVCPFFKLALPGLHRFRVAQIDVGIRHVMEIEKVQGSAK